MTHWRKFTSQRHPDFTLWGSPDLSCESTLWYLITVLCCHCNFCIQLLTGKIKVDGRGSTNHLCKAKHTVTLVTGEGQKPYPATDPKSQPREVIPLSWARTACPSSLTFGGPSATGQSLLSADSTAGRKALSRGLDRRYQPDGQVTGVSLGKCPDKRQGENPTPQPGPGLAEPGKAAPGCAWGCNRARRRGRGSRRGGGSAAWSSETPVPGGWGPGRGEARDPGPPAPVGSPGSAGDAPGVGRTCPPGPREPGSGFAGIFRAAAAGLYLGPRRPLTFAASPPGPGPPAPQGP